MMIEIVINIIIFNNKKVNQKIMIIFLIYEHKKTQKYYLNIAYVLTKLIYLLFNIFINDKNCLGLYFLNLITI